MFSNEQVYPYDGRDFLWIQNENLNFSTTIMAAIEQYCRCEQPNVVQSKVLQSCMQFFAVHNYT